MFNFFLTKKQLKIVKIHLFIHFLHEIINSFYARNYREARRNLESPKVTRRKNKIQSWWYLKNCFVLRWVGCDEVNETFFMFIQLWLVKHTSFICDENVSIWSCWRYDKWCFSFEYFPLLFSNFLTPILWSWLNVYDRKHLWKYFNFLTNLVWRFL